MFTRYFLGRAYRPVPYVVPLSFPEPTVNVSGAARTEPVHTLATLRNDVLRRLGDNAGLVWGFDEVETYLEQGYRELALVTRAFWDQAYLENLAAGFSSTAVWEAEYEAFSYGIGNYTGEDERRLEDESHRLGPANHTCPAEALDGWLSDCLAMATPAATSALPDGYLEIERAAWDNGTIEALSPNDLMKLDTRFRVTAGEVLGYVLRRDGPKTFRKVRVPAAVATTYDVDGEWGILREPADLTGEAATGTVGIPRRLPGHHPIGREQWGLPRRPYQDGKNVRIEYWREGRPLADGGELPAHYMIYLRFYALMKCCARNGPGQDDTLARFFGERWQRCLARLSRRREVQQQRRRRVMGEQSAPRRSGPPRPKLPWQYGRTVR